MPGTFFTDENNRQSFGGVDSGDNAITPLFSNNGFGKGSQYVKIDPLDTVTTTNQDAAGKKSLNTVFGDLLVTTRVPIISEIFKYNISPYNIVTGWAGSATGYVASNESQMTLQTGETVGSSGTVYTKKTVRYVAGYESVFMFTAEFANCSSGTTGVVGACDGVDGVYVGVFDGVFSLGYLDITHTTLEVPRVVQQSDFNLDTVDGTGNSGFAIDHSKNNLFRISFGWLGVATIYFEVFSSSLGWVPMHAMYFANIINGTHVGNPSLPIKAYVNNGATNNNVSVKCGSWHASIACQLIKNSEFDKFFTITKLDKNVNANTLTNLLTIKIPTVYFGKTNVISILLNFLSIAVAGNQSTDVRIYRNATIASASYQDYDIWSSVVGIYDGNTVVSGGDLVFSTLLAANQNDKIYLDDLNLLFFPGDTFTICAISTQSKVVDVSVRWRELA